MKTYRLLIVVLLAVVGLTASAQKKLSPNDSIMHTVKVKELTAKKNMLKKQIAIEDGKRNQVMNGVNFEIQEAMNDKQDSICLDLRSQLVAVELELKELVPDRTATAILGQLNLLNQNQQSDTLLISGGNTKE